MGKERDNAVADGTGLSADENPTPPAHTHTHLIINKFIQWKKKKINN